MDELKEQDKANCLKRTLAESELLKLKQEAGLIVLREGPGSGGYKQIAKQIQQAEDSLKDLKILGEAISEAIRQGKRGIRRREEEETAKRNRNILQRYEKDLPACPKCGTNKSVALVTIQPSKENVELGSTPVWSLSFECQRCEKSMGIRFSKYFDENGRERPPGLQKPI